MVSEVSYENEGLAGGIGCPNVPRGTFLFTSLANAIPY